MQSNFPIKGQLVLKFKEWITRASFYFKLVTKE